MDIGRRIKERREALGMSQEELAKKVGYTSRTTINKIENGANNLRQTKIAEFAHALGCTPSDLMGWADFNYDYVTHTWNVMDSELGDLTISKTMPKDKIDVPEAFTTSAFLRRTIAYVQDNPEYRDLIDLVFHVDKEDAPKVKQILEVFAGKSSIPYDNTKKEEE